MKAIGLRSVQARKTLASVSGVIAPANDSFDFEVLVAIAVNRARDRPVSHPSSTSPDLSPLTSPEVEPVTDTGLEDPPPLVLETRATNAQPSMISALPTRPLTFKVNRVLASDGPPAGANHAQRRKWMKGMERKAERAKKSNPYNPADIRPKTVNNLIRPSDSLPTNFDAKNLRHTQFAYTGGRNANVHKKIFTLEEIISVDLQFGFKLQKWDGK